MEPTPPFDRFAELLESYAEGRLALNEVRTRAQNVSINGNPESWVSETIKTPEGVVLVIGGELMPAETIARWGWGTQSREEEYLVKLAHEYAHVVQGHFDQDLTAWLANDGAVRENAPHIELYALLNSAGIINGLPKEDIYHAQNRVTGALDMRTYEDMTEILASSLLSPEYFAYRVAHARPDLSEDVVAKQWRAAYEITDHWKRAQASL